MNLTCNIHQQFLKQILYEYKIDNEYCVWLFNYLKDNSINVTFQQMNKEANVIHVRDHFQLRIINNDVILFNQEAIFNTIIQSKLPVVLIFDNFIKNHRKLLSINYISAMQHAIQNPNNLVIEQFSLLQQQDLQIDYILYTELNAIKYTLHKKIDEALDKHDASAFKYYSKLLNILLEAHNDI